MEIRQLLTEQEQTEILAYIRSTVSGEAVDLDKLPNWLRELVELKAKFAALEASGNNLILAIANDLRTDGREPIQELATAMSAFRKLLKPESEE